MDTEKTKVLDGQMGIDDFIEKEKMTLEELLQKSFDFCSEDDKKSMREVSEFFEIPQPTIRTLESELGLEFPRTNNKRRERYFTRQEVAIMAVIKFMKAQKKSNLEIEQYLLKEGYIQRSEQLQRQELTLAQMSPQKFLDEMKTDIAQEVVKQLVEFDDENPKLMKWIKEARDKDKELEKEIRDDVTKEVTEKIQGLGIIAKFKLLFGGKL